MKLRQKLVAVMAASMVITSVPVVTMAESSNTLSVYNYNIKDTTIGFTTTKHHYINASGKLTTGSTYYTNGINFNAKDNNLPKLEISPEYRYDLRNAVNGVQTNFLYLTTDSSFIKEAYVLYMDALYSPNGATTAYFDELGQLVTTTTWLDENNNPLSVNGKTAEAIINNGYIQIGYKVTGSYAEPVAPNTSGVTATIAIRPTEITETKYNDREYKQALRLDYRGVYEKGTTYPIPFLSKVGGDKEVLAYLDGNDSFVSSKTFTITGVLTDKKLVATSDTKTITVDNIEEIGEIRLDENTIGALANAEHRWIKVKLPSSTDLQFNLAKTTANIKATGKRGFFNTTGTVASGDIEVKFAEKSRSSKELDEQVMLIKLPRFTDPSAKGQVVLTGIFVEPKEKTAALGDVNVTVSEDFTQGGNGVTDAKPSTNLIDSTTLKVATVANYDVTLSCEPVSIKAGRSGVINDKLTTFTLKEAVKDSLVSTRKIEFSLENGYIFGPADIETTNSTTTSKYKAAAKARFQKLIDDETIKFEKDAEAKDGKKGFELTDIEVNADGYVTGFTGYFDRLSSSDSNELKITMPVATSLQATGEVKLTASNLFTRTYKEDVTCVVAKIVEPITVEVENAAIKVGLQDQAAGKITIKETDKGMIERGWMFLSAEDFQNGITFDAAPSIEVKGDDNKSTLKIENVQLSKDKKVVAFEVTRTSAQASSIEITDIKFTADRTVPEANYDLQIWGGALTDENVLDVITNANQNALTSASYRNQYTDMYIVKDFITMTTKNTQDITESGLKAATASFKIGEKQFTVNGEKVTMDVASYVKDGYIMVPVKYVAKAFGIEGNAIQYDKATSTATIIAGNKVISITSGKAYIIVNGTQIPMATKAEVKEGRMCVPMAYIAAGLGVEKSWDADTKTATFTNQAQ